MALFGAPVFQIVSLAEGPLEHTSFSRLFPAAIGVLFAATLAVMAISRVVDAWRACRGRRDDRSPERLASASRTAVKLAE